MTDRCSFVFDVVVTRYALPNTKLQDPKKITVLATLGNNTIEITSSRLNVSEFKHDARVEFAEKPKKLRDALEKCGIPVRFKYGKPILGEGRMSIPQSVIDKIDEGMSDLLHSDSFTIELNGEVVGTIEMLFRLVIKCDEQPVQECRQNMDKSINPHDIMFIMGESQHCPNPCDICPDVLDPDEGDERLKLDLQRYESINTNWSPDRILMHNDAGRAACCELKQMARECEEIVDTVTQNAGQPKPLKSPDNVPENPYTTYSSGSGARRPDPQEDHPCPPIYPNFTYLPLQPKANNDVCHPAFIPAPISDINKTDIKPSRFCPVCLTNMSWLPKFAACPKCGLKPTPVLEERHKDKKLTAEQILVDYLGKKPDGIDEYCTTPCDKIKEEEKADEPPECRCTCKFGKLCAHCRIRKLCADIFQAEEQTDCPTTKPKRNEDYCTIIENSQECRPYLSRVFSELRDLYNVKENKILTPHDRICPNNLPQSQSTGQKKSKLELKVKPKKVFSPEERKLKAQSPPEKKPRFGHKHCVNMRTAVSRYHGWDWISSPAHKKHGWRPGYILKPIKKLMRFFLQYLPEDNAFNVCKRMEQEEQKQKKSGQSILNVCKKNGEIYVTLRSANDPNVEMEPITFKIVKSELAVALRDIKRKLKEKGFRKCTCHRSLMLCVCRDHMEKRQLGQALQKECHRRGMENCVSQLVLTDTSDSEMEFDIDVTPPGGTVKPAKRLSRRKVNNSTQTSKKDKVVPKYPSPPSSAYWRTYDCAAGDRYRGTAFGSPGENVFEDGVFGFRGGGAHGESAMPGGNERSKLIWGTAPGEPLHGGRDGREGFGVDKSFPGKQRTRKDGAKNSTIPVKVPERFHKAAKEAAKAEKEAKIMEEIKRKKGINMMKYIKLRGMGGNPEIGPDGLTDAQRRRRALFEVILPSIDCVTRRGKGYDPCAAQCCNPCGQCCNPCGQCCSPYAQACCRPFGYTC